MADRLFAVLVRATATVTTIDAHLARPMRLATSAHHLGGYRLGGQFTGAWDPGCAPAGDPDDQRGCGACHDTSPACGAVCRVGSDAVDAGGRPRSVLPGSHPGGARYPGDIVALPRLLHPGWRFPPGGTPVAWVDLSGVVWLDTDQSTGLGAVPPRLLVVFRDLLAGRRSLDPTVPPARCRPVTGAWPGPWRRPGSPGRPRGWFEPAGWSVAVVDADS